MNQSCTADFPVRHDVLIDGPGSPSSIHKVMSIIAFGICAASAGERLNSLLIVSEDNGQELGYCCRRPFIVATTRHKTLQRPELLSRCLTTT